MVLIGARRSVEGHYFLLQNCWQDRHFIEVSAEYMHHCGATITFVNKAIITRKDDLIHLSCRSPYGETNLDNDETSVEH